MMDPKTAVWLGGRSVPEYDRNAEQMAALRDASDQDTSSGRPTIDRLHAFFSRTSRPSHASCDCTD